MSFFFSCQNERATLEQRKAEDEVLRLAGEQQVCIILLFLMVFLFLYHAFGFRDLRRLFILGGLGIGYLILQNKGLFGNQLWNFSNDLHLFVSRLRVDMVSAIMVGIRSSLRVVFITVLRNSSLMFCFFSPVNVIQEYSCKNLMYWVENY